MLRSSKISDAVTHGRVPIRSRRTRRRARLAAVVDFAVEQIRGVVEDRAPGLVDADGDLEAVERFENRPEQRHVLVVDRLQVRALDLHGDAPPVAERREVHLPEARRLDGRPVDRLESFFEPSQAPPRLRLAARERRHLVLSRWSGGALCVHEFPPARRESGRA